MEDTLGLIHSDDRFRRVLLLIGSVWLVVTGFGNVHASEDKFLGHLGVFAKWAKVELSFQGPESQGMSLRHNPFHVDVDVFFTGPHNRTYTVDAFYDGDGNGGMNGTVWTVRFSPDAVGKWYFNTSSSEPRLHGYRGSFTVTPVSPDARFFAEWGRLKYVGGHFLKFQDGPYWLKGGADEPESFLASDVVGDWSQKKAAADYLARKGVNSLYILLQNVSGDGDNVWPWVSKFDSEHFDLAKLAKWEELFSYLQARGIVLHLIFEDDSGWTGFNRSLYYREMIARFGHHNGLYWNISEEYNENYSPGQVKRFARMIRELDPYDHPLTVHNEGSLSNWVPFYGDVHFDVTSFQTAAAPQNLSTIQGRYDSVTAGRPLAIMHDETGQFSLEDRHLSRNVVWSVYMGGGGIELFTKNVDTLGFPAYDHFWDDLRRARVFMESLPFWEMRPSNHLLVGGTGNQYCFAKPGEAYALYLEKGHPVSLDLRGHRGMYAVQWYNVRTGEYTNGPQLRGGEIVSLGAPAFSDDVAARIRLIETSPSSFDTLQ